jgi:hypothetical protein
MKPKLQNLKRMFEEAAADAVGLPLSQAIEQIAPSIMRGVTFVDYEGDSLRFEVTAFWDETENSFGAVQHLNPPAIVEIHW